MVQLNELLRLIMCQFFNIKQALLGSLTERITSTAIKHKRMNTVFFLGETIKEKTLQLPQRQNQHQNNKSPKTVSDLPTAVIFFLSSPSVFSFLNYALHLSVDELCDKQRLQFSIYTNPDMTKTLPSMTSTRRV